MFGLTVLDYVYIAIIVGSAIWAAVRGGIYETIATLSWVIAAFAARFISPHLDVLLQKWFDLSGAPVTTLVASYFIVFFVILIAVGFINQKLRERIQDSILSVTDKTLGIIFGIIRGIVVMGLVYWGLLWYYSDVPQGKPAWLEKARTRPVMQLTAYKLDEWFFSGVFDDKLLLRDRAGEEEMQKIFNNLIKPAVEKTNDKSESGQETTETGYKSSERAALENQLLQIESVANTIQEINEEKQ